MTSWAGDVPHLIAEWSPKNGFDICTVTRGSNRVVWWQCSRGHEWEASVKSRTVMKSGCPFCSGRRAIPGETDLTTLYPDVAAMWSPRNDVDISTVTAKSHAMRKWQCPRGHEWERTTAQQTKVGNCPFCTQSGVDTTANNLADLFPELAKEWSSANSFTADTCLPSLTRPVEWVCRTCSTKWKTTPARRVRGSTPCPSCSGKTLNHGVNTLDVTHPDVAKWWAEGNALKPQEVTFKSYERIFWTCSEGHRTVMAVNKRVSKGDNYCGKCAMRRGRPPKPAKEKAVIVPVSGELAQQWSPRNTVPVHQVSHGSRKVFWWRCSEGHEWESSPHDRKRTGCPYCTNRKVMEGFNDLATTHPILAEQWMPRNASTAKQVYAGSAAKGWWRCSAGHEWEATLSNRSRAGTGCPVCAGKKAVAGVTDLATTHPHLASQWHPDNEVKPSRVLAGSARVVKWKGDCGHVWDTKIEYRAKSGSGCPFCSGNRILVGFNDLATTRPDIARQWHPDNTLKPTEVSAGANTPIKWVCDEGHMWEAWVLSRSQGYGCAVCAGKKVLAGFNDLASQFPALAAEWSAKNHSRPTEHTRGSRKQVWWVCSKGHEWLAPILNRTQVRSGCPYCANHTVLKGFNDLATLRPDVAAQWHSTKNCRTPDSVVVGSNQDAWWVCDKGHEWRTRVYARTGAGTGCPSCSTGVSKGETEVADFLKSILGEGNVVTSYRALPGVSELDIYIPSLNVGVEYHGVYWHTDRFRDSKAHLAKLEACEKNGVRLIQVWEDSWRDRRNVVENMLRTRVRKSTHEKVNARSLEHRLVPKESADELLDSHHIQGSARGTYYDGLVSPDDELMAVMVTLEVDKQWRIERYAASANVRGGFGKLLSALEKRIALLGGGQIVTFADREISDGRLYMDNGFRNDKVLDPDYSYVVDGVRKHKFNYRLKRFRDDPALEYREGMTERELAELNGLNRAWDSGKIRFVKDVDGSGHA